MTSTMCRTNVVGLIYTTRVFVKKLNRRKELQSRDAQVNSLVE